MSVVVEQRSWWRQTLHSYVERVEQHMHPKVRRNETYRGGGGIEKALSKRRSLNQAKRIFHDESHWLRSVFVLKGRSFNWQAMLVHMIYSILISAAVIYGLDTPEEAEYAAKLQSVQGFFGRVLGFLLSFRLNQAYNRWWEGKKTWDQVKNAIINLVRTSRVLVPPEHKDIQRKLVAYAGLFARVHRSHLLKHKELIYYGDLPEEEYKAVAESPRMPLFVLGRMTELVKEAEAGGTKNTWMLEMYTSQLSAALSAANTIATTPVPFAYTTHLRSILLLSLANVPFYMAVVYRWYALIIDFFAGFVFFGIEAVAEEIETPFGIDYSDLPMHLYYDDIVRCISTWPDSFPDAKKTTTGFEISSAALDDVEELLN